MPLREHLSAWWAGARTPARIAVLGGLGLVVAVAAAGITSAVQPGSGDAALPVSVTVVDCSHTELYQSPDVRGLLTARVAVVDITNNGSTAQTVEVLANGTPLASNTGTQPATFTLQPGQMTPLSFPINPEKYGSDEGQCWSFPFTARASTAADAALQPTPTDASAAATPTTPAPEASPSVPPYDGTNDVSAPADEGDGPTFHAVVLNHDSSARHSYKITYSFPAFTGSDGVHYPAFSTTVVVNNVDPEQMLEPEFTVPNMTETDCHDNINWTWKVQILPGW